MTSRFARISCLSLAAAVTVAACADPTDETADELASSADGKADGAKDPGALIAVSMTSKVGVLLVDVPGADRDRVAAAYLARPAGFWEARARRQLEATLYRLVYRTAFYNKKGQLPLPPVERWNIVVKPAARGAVDGLDLVLAEYTFTSTLLTDAGSPSKSDKALQKIGGSVDERFVLPADPEMLFERTGYACMDEEDFPPNSVDSENALSFYDQDCAAGEGGCHVTLPAPTDSCDKALKASVGRVSAAMAFKRLAWSAAAANAARVGANSSAGAQLKVVKEGVEDNRLIYRYIPASSCAIAEGCVGGSGWRRLLQFTATVKNLGAKAAHIGDVSDTSPASQHNMFEFSACHQHMHFSHYGKFTFSGGNAPNLGSKKAFCLESTSRYLNNERTPLTHDYGCYFQGIAAGWGDDYIAGIECQWIDVTPLDTSAGPVAGSLTFDANPDAFLCEGEPVLDAQGNFTFEPTAFRTETGAVVDRFQCRETPGWQDDNTETVPVSVPPEGSYVTTACTRGSSARSATATSPSRTTGWRAPPDSPCSSGARFRPARRPRPCGSASAARCSEPGSRARTATHSRASSSISGGSNVTVKCPPARDANEPGGAWATFTAPAFGSDARAAVTCSPR